MTAEEIRTKLGLKTPEQFYIDHVVPRLRQPHDRHMPVNVQLTMGTGKTTEMLLRACARVVAPDEPNITLVGSHERYTRALAGRLQGMLEDLGRPECFE